MSKDRNEKAIANYIKNSILIPATKLSNIRENIFFRYERTQKISDMERLGKISSHI